MNKPIFKVPLVFVKVITMMLLLISFNGVSAEPSPQIKDQMVCHAGKILTVLNKNYLKKSLTCIKRSTQTKHEYNNLSEVYAEKWFVEDINDSNTWVFEK